MFKYKGLEVPKAHGVELMRKEHETFRNKDRWLSGRELHSFNEQFRRVSRENPMDTEMQSLLDALSQHNHSADREYLADVCFYTRDDGMPGQVVQQSRLPSGETSANTAYGFLNQGSETRAKQQQFNKLAQQERKQHIDMYTDAELRKHFGPVLDMAAVQLGLRC